MVARLVAAGMDRPLAEAAVRRMTEAECRIASDQILRRALSVELESSTEADEGFERCEVFVGPPGVGKTTTIAKIAAQERVRQNRALNLVSADGFRAGAIEQLRGYAEIMAVPFRAARTAEELAEAVASARNPVLVDTAGRSKADEGATSLLEGLCQTRRVRTHLVLAADTAPVTARRVIDRYAELRPSRVVITKLDEADSVMPLFGVLREHGFSYFVSHCRSARARRPRARDAGEFGGARCWESLRWRPHSVTDHDGRRSTRRDSHCRHERQRRRRKDESDDQPGRRDGAPRASRRHARR